MDSTGGIIAILLAGVIVVVGSILWLRLHAFLALVLASLVVAFLTPASTLLRFYTHDASLPVKLDENAGRCIISAKLESGLQYELIGLDATTRTYRKLVTLRITGPAEVGGTEAAFESPTEIDFSQFESLRAIHSSEMGAAKKAAGATIGSRVAAGFGSTCGKIGILIAMAAIIGKCLLDSGAADRIVRTTLGLFGERGAPMAFMTSGFFLGIPVFFDTVFYLMIPLGKAMRVRTGKNYILYVLTIVCGATMAHSLVPPTPGPLQVAEELGVDLGVMIIGGSIVAMFAAVLGYVYATIVNRRVELPLRESADFSIADLEEAMSVDERELPSFFVSSLPILLPVVLISLDTFLSKGRFGFTPSDWMRPILSTLGDKNIALVLSAIIAMATLVRQKRRSFEELATSIQSALASGGIIILITSAGGAFGQILRETGVAELIQSLPQASPQVICTLAFLITTAIRTAQGSATVAMITTAGIMSGIARDGQLPFDPFYLAAAIGAGSKPIAWMNDSGFWVITKMSGMTETEGLKYITPMTTFMGLTGLVVVLVGVTVFPNF